MPDGEEVKDARREDVPAMVALSAKKRAEGERAQPVFWRRAAGADEKQRAWFETVLARPGVVALVARSRGVIEGFLLSQETAAPPVYAPGGTTFAVDDFCVASPDRWETTGRALLAEASRRVRALGAAQVVVVCGAHDAEKRALLRSVGLSVASEWYVGMP